MTSILKTQPDIVIHKARVPRGDKSEFATIEEARAHFGPKRELVELQFYSATRAEAALGLRPNTWHYVLDCRRNANLMKSRGRWTLDEVKLCVGSIQARHRLPSSKEEKLARMRELVWPLLKYARIGMLKSDGLRIVSTAVQAVARGHSSNATMQISSLESIHTFSNKRRTEPKVIDSVRLEFAWADLLLRLPPKPQNLAFRVRLSEDPEFIEVSMSGVSNIIPIPAGMMQLDDEKFVDTVGALVSQTLPNLVNEVIVFQTLES